MNAEEISVHVNPVMVSMAIGDFWLFQIDYLDSYSGFIKFEWGLDLLMLRVIYVKKIRFLS